MPNIEFASEVMEDFDRIFDHLQLHDAHDIESRINEIVRAIDVLESNPYIGRPVNELLRELVIGKESHGYIALYSYVSEIDIVFVLAIRSQREAGYRHA